MSWGVQCQGSGTVSRSKPSVFLLQEIRQRKFLGSHLVLEMIGNPSQGLDPLDLSALDPSTQTNLCEEAEPELRPVLTHRQSRCLLELVRLYFLDLPCLPKT